MAKRLIRRRARKVVAATPTTSDITAVLSNMARVLGDISTKLDDITEDGDDAPMEPEPEVPLASTRVDIGADVEDSTTRDQRERSRKIYHLAKGAPDRTNQIPDRPSSARKVFRYLAKFDAATVKQMSVGLILEKKTIGNGVSELMRLGLVKAIDLPRA